MKRRPLMILAEQPPLQTKWEAYSVICDEFDAQVDLLREKALSILEEKSKMKKAYWDDLVVSLKDKLPLDYSHEKYALQFDDGVLYISPRETVEAANMEELPDFIKALVRSFGEGNVVVRQLDDGLPTPSGTVH